MRNGFRSLSLVFDKNGRRIERTAADSPECRAEIDAKTDRLTVRLFPKSELGFVRFSIAFDYAFPPDARVFLNGYQSWTNSRELKRSDRLVGIKPLAALLPPARDACACYGDYSFAEYGKKAGEFHGYTYAYVRNGAEVTLYGSAGEDDGFTVFRFDLNRNIVSIEKDLEGFCSSAPFTALDVFRYVGEYEAVFDRYFHDLGVGKPRVDVLNGYTSWYHYFQNIDRNILLRDLGGIARAEPKPDIFQIDDGYETAVGDWLSVDRKKFPNGVKEIADAAHAEKLFAGLWLAPFVAERRSALFQTHPDWFLRDEKGRPRLGCIAWHGAYILDFYRDEVREYLKKTFDTVLDEWGFDLVKLDFLYAVCLYPQRGKTRGAIMADAMRFLRELAGPKLILGCGVPLGSAFGRVDFCRISADADLRYTDGFLARHTNREIVSTRCALENAVFRRHLDGRAFGNDPDVFFLRKGVKYTEKQKEILATVNSLLGSVRFVSDDAGGYGAEQRELLKRAFSRSKQALLSAEMTDRNRAIELVYDEDGERKTLTIPLRG